MTQTAYLEATAELGREIDLDSPKAVREAIFGQLQLPATVSTSQGPSIATPALTELHMMTGSPFVAALLRYRASKARR
jgi:DNA polymerase I-like protein with 3'-5' exonuclease and polymerase domains